MFSKFFLIPAILSAAFVLGEDVAQAQSRGGGYRGGGSGGGRYSGFSAGGFYGGWGSPYRSGYGNYGYGGWGSPYRYGYSNYGYGNYAYPGYYPDYSSYYADPGSFAPIPSQTVDNSARIRVILPDAQGRVWFDGNATLQTGRDRLFTTPPLSSGANYNYRIRASWMQGNQEMVQERTISVIPGQTAVVDFTQPAESLSLPKPGQ